MSFRTVKDSMGELQVPEEALWGAQTQRAINNFPISGRSLPAPFVISLLLAKSAAARANSQLGMLETEVAEAIVAAVDQLLADDDLMTHFPVDVFQTGSGTSTNMNANEVIATLASRSLGREVSANDHVNCGQSSNDIIPSTIHISAAVTLSDELIPALDHLQRVIREKATTVDGCIKTGRTHLMDAMPIRLSQSLGAWAEQIRSCRKNLDHQLTQLLRLAQGGTAVGTGINAHPEFAELFNHELSKLTGLPFQSGPDLFMLISSQDVAVQTSGSLKTLAVALMKIANDLRWMNSGPLAGLGEIELEALQPGSSIMPGKVNPVIPEATAMVAAQIIGNDTAITIGGQSGNFELNVMLPLIAFNLLGSIELATNASQLLADKAIATFTVNEANLQQALARNPILVTALNPIVGYMKAADIAKQAYQEKRPVLDVADERTNLSREELERLLDPAKLTQGGI